jgi:hypothetical protein
MADKSTPAYEAYERQACDEPDNAMEGEVRGNLKY